MIKSKYINIICIGAAALAALLTLLLMAVPGTTQKVPTAGSGLESSPEYAGRLFDPDRVHTIDIRIGDWGIT